jgi:DNA-binding CsgD family transcriptional regulator
MNNSAFLPLIPYLAALSTGFITLCSTIFLYMKQRNKIYLYFTLLLFSMLSKLLYVVVKLYIENNQAGNEFVLLFLKTIKALGVSIFLFILPVMINHIMLSRLNLLKKIIISLISVSVFFIFLLDRFFNIDVPYSYIIANLLFILVLVNRRQKKIIVTFLLLAVIFLPITIFDFISGETSIQIPVYFIIINILGVIFSFFFLLPPSVTGNEKLTDYLQKKYNITEREKEIIILIQTGCSNNDISDKISISVSTVEKHINNIYRKLNIKNRVQLINFIQSGLQ